MRRPVASLFTVVLVLSSGIPLVADAAGSDPVRLRYDVQLLDREESRYQVEVTFSNIQDNLVSVNLLVDRYVAEWGACSNLVVDGRSKPCSGQHQVDLEGRNQLRYRFTTTLDKPAGNGGYNSVTTSGWAVLQASGVGFSFDYSYRGDAPTFDVEMVFSDLPQDWDAEASFPKSGETFHAESRFPRPAGIIALGDFTRRTCDVSGRTVVVAEIAAPEHPLCPPLEGTHGFLESALGDHIGPKVLAVVAPDPFKSGGVATRDGFAVHERASEQTIVHEFVHLHQRFEAVNRVGEATVWIKEGGAEYYSALALFAAKRWSGPRVQTFFDDLYDEADRKGHLEEPLDDAIYGSSIERTAYTRGALVIGKLDDELKDRTGKEVDVDAVMLELNDDKVHPNEPDDDENETLTESNVEFRARIEQLSGSDFGTFFQDYVHGRRDPGRYEFEPTGTFRIHDLQAGPPPVVAGDPIEISVNVTNTGLEADSKTITVFFADVPVANATVSLQPGESRIVSTTLAGRSAGVYRVTVGTSSVDLRVLEAADLRLDGFVTEPDPPTSDGYDILASVANRGEVPGTGLVRLLLDGTAIAAENVTVPGQGRDHVRFPADGAPGPVNATAELVFEGRTTRTNGSWAVRSASAFRSLRRELPAPGLALVVVGLAVATGVVQRRKR